jgi:hypothetical protein
VFAVTEDGPGDRNGGHGSQQMEGPKELWRILRAIWPLNRSGERFSVADNACHQARLSRDDEEKPYQRVSDEPADRIREAKRV